MGHFGDMLKEREIMPEWAERTRSNPDMTEEHDDGTKHFIKCIPEFGNRWLRVIVNVAVTPERPVTAFFDRRMRKRHENQSGQR